MVPQKTAAVMQPYFWPYIGYFQLINASDVFLPYGHVAHRKKSWITRNRMVIGNQVTWVGPSISGQSSHVDICDVLVSNDAKWRRQLIDRITNSYRRAAHFDETIGLVVATVESDATNLDQFNTASIILLAQHLGITTPIATVDADLLAHETQVREIADPATRMNARAALLTRGLGAGCYLNPSSGSALYTADVLRQFGAGFAMLEPDLGAVRDLTKVSDPSLSILHLLMHAGRDNVQAALGCCNFVGPAPLDGT